jgi:hypothetical protein
MRSNPTQEAPRDQEQPDVGDDEGQDETTLLEQ